MKKLLSLITFLFMIGGLLAQGANDYTKWRFTVVQEPGSNEATLVTKAITDDGWHGYSSVPADEFSGPLPTEFTYDDASKFELVGAIKETGFHTHYDEIQEVDVTEFDHEGVFKQKIKINSSEDFVITGNISYMVCESGGMCVAGDKPFAFSVKGVKAKETAKVDTPKEEPTKEEPMPEKTDETVVSIQDLVFWEYKIFETVEDKEYEIILTPEFEDSVSIVDASKVVIIKSGDSPLEFSEFKAQEKGYVSTIKFEGKEEPGALLHINFDINHKGAQSKVEQELPIALASTVRLTKGNCEPKTYDGIGATNEIKKSYVELFIGAFLAGLVALLTPCVFPMIPMTVTFFMKGAENTTKSKGIRKALLFGFSIIGIYTIIGTIVAVLFGAAFANWLATHWVPNILFFLIFMVFAASFLGLFEIRLPSSMVNKADAQADKGGLTGIFFMALTLVLVSFSCTGPIVGSILISAAQGGVIEPMLGMFAFSFAIALPFTLFAIFPNWLSKLPQSGGWLNSVKVVLGFVEIALGLKFLSVADQTYHWGLLDREVYIALWIVIFTLMGFYLIGKIKFSHDSDMPFVKVPRLFMGIAVFSFVVYLTPGLIGHPLKALSGYLPPMSTHDFDLMGAINGTDEYQCEGDVLYSDFLHLPHGIAGYFDLDQAKACAKAQDKPVFIDFTGHGCVNCREMEAKVWSDPEVLKLLKEEFVVVALYCDDKTVLPEDKWYESKVDGKMKKTIGDQNLDYQICNFDNNAQPLYVTLDQNGNLLASPVAYDTEVENFKNFLKLAISNYKMKK